MNISILCKGNLEDCPPIMSLAIALKELGHEVEVVTSRSEFTTIKHYGDNKITIVNLFTNLEFSIPNILSKAIHWREFSNRAWKHIYDKTQDTLLWIGTADTALALGKRLHKQRYVLQILELYDKLFIYRFLLEKYAQHASCVVTPEICRAAIFRSYFSLRQTPLVLPNKPTYHPRRQNLEIEDKQAKDILAKIDPKEKLVLYQGHLGFDREIRSVAEAVWNMKEGWRFVAMGPKHDGYLDMLRISCPNLVYIPKVIAPYHLQITSHAYIGVIAYSWDSLNNVFCAPNKIWEYSGFGLPMICSDLPSLQYSAQANHAGLCVEMSDRSQIESALDHINKNYDLFSKHSRQLYDSVDIPDIIQRIIHRALHYA